MLIWKVPRPLPFSWPLAPEQPESAIAGSFSTTSGQPTFATSEKESPRLQSPSGAKASPGLAAPSTPIRYVRIKEAYLDRFLQDVSHLFITGELLRELESRIPESALGRNLAEELHRICQDLRLQLDALHRSAASLRRVSAGELFAPYPRMARSLAAQLNKKVRVLLEGEEVEIDRALARELESPLTHLVRNAVDHGIEPPAERAAKAADEIGTIRLSAQRTPHGIRISVADDGRGIDPARIRAKAVEKRLLSPQQAQALSDTEAIQWIFHPGFSTAEKVSEVSGRGVGMDVVRAVVDKHRGTVQVESQPGQGTKIHLTFPVRETVLVVDGLLVRENHHLLVLPMEQVRQILQIRPQLLATVQGRPVLRFRQRCYEVVWVTESLGWANHRTDPLRSGPAALVGPEGKELCLRFDELLGHRQVVVHCLEEIFPTCTRAQGVALLGGGRLALVLNIPQILAQYRSAHSTARISETVAS